MVVVALWLIILTMLTYVQNYSGLKSVTPFSFSKGSAIFNAGDRGGRILRTNRKVFLTPSRNSIEFDTPFQEREKLYTPTEASGKYLRTTPLHQA